MLLRDFIVCDLFYPRDYFYYSGYESRVNPKIWDEIAKYAGQYPDNLFNPLPRYFYDLAIS